MKTKVYLVSLLVVFITVGSVVMFRNQLFLSKSTSPTTNNVISDSSFGWKFPISQFIPSGQVTDTGAYSKIRTAESVAKGLPVRLQIPIIGVNSTIEDAYITSDGRMDVPAGSENVAWFALGPEPGQKGSAVIGGHYGIDNGIPKVFYNLNNLKVGDKVYVVDDFGNTLAFMVSSIRLFDRNADSTSVFISNDGLAHLNIITCEGVWNKVNDSYPDRRVIFTDAIPGEGPVVSKKTQTSTTEPIPSLPQTDITATPEASISSTPSFFEKMISGIIDTFNNIRR